MARKIVKKRKIKLLNFSIVLFSLIGLFFGAYFLLQIPIQNIVIRNTQYLSDDYIIELAGIKNYPRFFLLSKKSVQKKLEKSSYIYNVKIHKKWGFILVLDVVENSPLFFNSNVNQYALTHDVLVSEDAISREFRVPRLLNYVPDQKYKKFVSSMSNVREDTLSKISDIEYQPNDYDKDRFLLYMDDGNMVYLTLTKFKMINHYNVVLTQLEGHKGILYLDSGNHFQIKE